MYGAENSHSSKHRPLTSKQKAKKIKVPYPLSNKQRDCIRCFECGKERVIFTEKKLKLEEQLLLDEIKNTIHFRCGDVLFADDKEYDMLKQKRFCVDRRKICSFPIETSLYSLKKKPICIACGKVLPNEIQEKAQKAKESWSTVLPNCESKQCLKFMEF